MKNIKLGGKSARGMANLSESHILVGDKSGTLSNLNWKEMKIIWSKKCHENNNHFSVIQITSDKTKVIFINFIIILL